MPMRGPTTDHDEIRRWAIAHHAIPAAIQPYVFDSEPAILRFLFDPATAQSAQPLHPEILPISWEDFFAHFDLMGLALVYEVDETGHPGMEHELLQIENRSAYQFSPRST